MRPTARLLVPALCSLLPGQTISVLEGANPADLTLRTYDENNPGAPGQGFLSGLQMLPIEMTNRTAQMAFAAGRTRLREQQGLRFLDLPAGGKVFAFRRRAPAVSYGFLLIGSDGSPTLLHELPGTGPTGSDDPYEDRIAAAPDGRHGAITSLDGRFWVVRLDGGTFASTGTPSRQLALPPGVLVEPRAVAVGRSQVFVVTNDDRIRRGALADRSPLQDVTPPSQPGDRIKDGLAPSGTGDEVAFLLGPKVAYSIYLLRSSGAAVRLPPAPAKYEEPGYLPELSGGPRLMLNQDATRLLYIDATIRDEIFVLDVTGQTATTHVTSDANFQPYIGAGIFPTFAANLVVLAVGDQTGFDWFVAGTQSSTVLNLTGTGNRPVPPFEAGTLQPRSGFFAGDGALLTAEQQPGGAIALRRIDPVTGRSTYPVGLLRAAPELGTSLGGTPSLLLPGTSGDMLLGPHPQAAALPGPPGVHLSLEVASSSGIFGVFTATDAASGFTVPVLRFPGVGLFLAPPFPAGLQQLCLTRRDGVLLNGSTLRYMAIGVDVTLPGSPAVRIVVSGASN